MEDVQLAYLLPFLEWSLGSQEMSAEFGGWNQPISVEERVWRSSKWPLEIVIRKEVDTTAGVPLTDLGMEGGGIKFGDMNICC